MVFYLQNRYQMPKGTYRPGRQAHIEVDEQNGLVRFFDHRDGELLEEHRLATGVGKRVSNAHPQRDSKTQYRELIDKVLTGFGRDERAEIFVPEHVHPHQFRHTRAIHWYRSGIPLSLVSDYLGHVNLQTTLIYAYADTEMKRKAIEKVDSKNSVSPSPLPIWKNDDDMIRQLYCLKQ